MSKKRKKGKSSLFNKFMIFFVIIAVASSIFSIYEILLLSSIETLIRYIVIGVLILLDLIIIFKCHRIRKFDENKKKKKPKKRLFMFLIILYIIICLLIGGTIFYVYGKINGLNKTFVTYTSDLLVMSTNQANDISDVKDMKIGILKDDTNPEGAIIPKEIIKENNLNDENEVTDYDNYTSMLVDLYSGDLDAMFISNHYVSMFSGITGYENIESETKVIAKKSKKMRKAGSSAVETASSGKSITEPFTMLLMGIDSTDEVLEQNAIANGDTLILLTFNPKTLNATMFSIPRDSYVPIACWSGKPENKITHAAAYGNDCMISTIQDYFDVNIDYYAKINFKGLVKLVDAVGGVEVDVPKVLCTDDSSRGDMVVSFLNDIRKYDVTGSLIDSFEAVDKALYPEAGTNGVAEFTLDERNFMVSHLAVGQAYVKPRRADCGKGIFGKEFIKVGFFCGGNEFCLVPNNYGRNDYSAKGK